MDYIFYRIYLYYKKKDDIPIATGIFFVFVVQFCSFFLIGTIINLITNGLISDQNFDLKKESFWIGYAVFLFIIFVIDVFRYRGSRRIKMLEKRFNKIKINDIIKTWQIFILPILLVGSALSLIIFLS